MINAGTYTLHVWHGVGTEVNMVVDIVDACAIRQTI